MPRPQRYRRICALPEHTTFLSPGEDAGAPVTLSLDEYEAIRLMDREGRTHEQCAEIMQVSRTTVTEIYAAARKKLAEALVDGRGLVINGGRVRLCDHSSPCGYGCCGSPERGLTDVAILTLALKGALDGSNSGEASEGQEVSPEAMAALQNFGEG